MRASTLKGNTMAAPATTYDIIIVGGGPAGLTAALYAGRSTLKTLLIENKAMGGQLLNTELIDDYPGAAHIFGSDLAATMVKQAEEFGTTFLTATVEKIRAVEGHMKEVATDEGTYTAPAVIITAGGLPRKLGIPGEERLAGSGVSYCAVCDGAFFKNRELAVIGGGDAALEEGMYLTRYASKVTIIHRRDSFRAQPVIVEEAKKNPKIAFLMDTVVDEIAGEYAVQELHCTNVNTHEKTTLTVNGAFIFIGFLPNTSLIEGHVAHDAGGYYLTDPLTMMTSVDGIFAAGDVRSQLTRQITTAVGDATTATIAAVKYIEAVEKGLPIPFAPYEELAGAGAERG